jgi:hypothetical protein
MAGSRTNVLESQVTPAFRALATKVQQGTMTTKKPENPCVLILSQKSKKANFKNSLHLFGVGFC